MDFYQEKNLQLRTEADALQAKNFKPDLAAENPRGDLVVTASQIEKGNLLKAVEAAGEELQEICLLYTSQGGRQAQHHSCSGHSDDDHPVHGTFHDNDVD